MTTLATAVELSEAGTAFEALEAVVHARLSTPEKIAAQVLTTELLLRTGKLADAELLATRLLSSRSLVPSQKSCCEYVLGKIAKEHADYDKALVHLYRATALATESKDLKRLCLAQMSLLVLMTDRNGPEASGALLSDLRSNVIKLGDRRVTANLHVWCGEIEAKRGLLRTAHRHAMMALDVLRDCPNPQLEAVAENLLLATAIIRSDLHSALAHGTRAVGLAEQSGHTQVRRASIGNLGNTYYSLGQFDLAIDCFDRAFKTLPSASDENVSRLESMARVRLAQGQLVECEELLDTIDASIASERDRTLYGRRYVVLTRTNLLLRLGRFDDALRRIDTVLALAQRVDDGLLRTRALLTKAELLVALRRLVDAADVLFSAVDRMDTQSPELWAHYQRVLAWACAIERNWDAATDYRQRAIRICRSSGDAAAEIDVQRNGAIIVGDEQIGERHFAGPAPSRTNPISIVQSIASTLALASRPDVAGRELLAVIDRCGCAEAASLLSCADDGAVTIVTAIGAINGTVADQPARDIVVGAMPGRTIRIAVQPKNDFESRATLKAIELIVNGIHELQASRAANEERATLWPPDEMAIRPSGFPILGHLREVLTNAQRVARTTVNVLITGESGTGKEIVARAIHDFSDRAQKPFIPVNCSAVPRELLESQLFGHRRGAFTGADRDHTGFIRAARDGTLFLDEIADLSLDLQPKLLRFLESGEISPLGETAPQTVNVRILAATNTNLEDAVRQGKFREDLFYRLNVVRLSIRPLRERRDEIPGLVNHFVARSAQEFKKGQLTVAEETMERLLLYRWPGNVRQLQNEIRRIVALAEPNSTVTPDAISEDILCAMPIFRQVSNGSEIAVSLHDKLPATVARIESEMIKVALRDHHGRVDAAARALGISRKGLYLKRQRLGL